MTTRTQTWDYEEGADPSPGFYARAYRQATHPRYALLYGLAILWAGYLTWIHAWQLALGVLVAGKALALAAVWTVDVGDWLDSPYGRLIRAHYHPVNIALHVAGFAGLAYGLWRHDPIWLLGGLTVAGLGHLWGWTQKAA